MPLSRQVWRGYLRYCLPFVWLSFSYAAVAEIHSSNLVLDNHFARGVRVVPPSIVRDGEFPKNVGRPQSICLPQRNCSGQPVWQLQQWGGAQDIAGAVDVDSTWILRDSAARIQKSIRLKSGDPVDGDVALELNGLSEFSVLSQSGMPRYLPDLGAAWPHWLLSQQLQTGRLGQYTGLMLSGQLKLLLDKQQRQDGYDPALHAARLVLAMTVRSRLTGDYFWLTLPLYDDRFSQSDFGCQKCVDDNQCKTPQSLIDPGIWSCPEDKAGEQWWHNEKTGTARMIFRVPTKDFIHGEVKSGLWVQVSGDLMPYVRAGIEAVRQREGTQQFPADVFFYELGLFSLGWEMTGFNHVAVQLRDWQLDAVRQKSVAESP